MVVGRPVNAHESGPDKLGSAGGGLEVDFEWRGRRGRTVKFDDD